MLVVLLVVLLLAGVGFWLSRKNKREAKRLGAKFYAPAKHLIGIQSLKPKDVVYLFFADEQLVMKAGKNTFNLNYEKLTAVEAVHKTDLVTKKKSVIGRGVVGGLAFGGVGAVVGALSAVGGEKAVKGDLLVLYYTPNDKNETKAIVFDMIGKKQARKCAQYITEQRPELAEPQITDL